MLSKNPRSTVGTITEVMDYLRLLYSRVGTAHCLQCGTAIEPRTAFEITEALAALPAGTPITLLAPIPRPRKGNYAPALARARDEGYTRARVDGLIAELAEADPDAGKLELVVDGLRVPDRSDQPPRDGAPLGYGD